MSSPFSLQILRIVRDSFDTTAVVQLLDPPKKFIEPLREAVEPLRKRGITIPELVKRLQGIHSQIAAYEEQRVRKQQRFMQQRKARYKRIELLIAKPEYRRWQSAAQQHELSVPKFAYAVVQRSFMQANLIELTPQLAGHIQEMTRLLRRTADNINQVVYRFHRAALQTGTASQSPKAMFAVLHEQLTGLEAQITQYIHNHPPTR